MIFILIKASGVLFISPKKNKSKILKAKIVWMALVKMCIVVLNTCAKFHKDLQ